MSVRFVTATGRPNDQFVELLKEYNDNNIAVVNRYSVVGVAPSATEMEQIFEFENGDVVVVLQGRQVYR